jgi:hypothetical protein
MHKTPSQSLDKLFNGRDIFSLDRRIKKDPPINNFASLGNDFQNIPVIWITRRKSWIGWKEGNITLLKVQRDRKEVLSNYGFTKTYSVFLDCDSNFNVYLNQPTQSLYLTSEDFSGALYYQNKKPGINFIG